MMEIKQIVFAPFRLDLADERLFRGKEVFRLHPKAFAVLRCLTESAGGLVTKHTLMETVWPGLHVTDAVLTESIRELRKALGDNPKKPRFIETVHRRGYRFIAPVNTISQPAQGESGSHSVSLTAADEGPSVAKFVQGTSTIGALPLVGRECELSFLAERLESAIQGNGSVVFITGPAGIGKTRLAVEVRRDTQRKGCRWLGGKYEKAVSQPYKAWAEIIRNCFYQHENSRRLVDRYAANLAKIVPEIEPPANAATTARGDPEAERNRLFDDLIEFLIQASREAPLVLFLDDLQWAPSVEPLRHLSEQIGNQPILTLAAYRDSELRENPSLWRTVLEMNRQRLFFPLPLKPLDQKGVAELLSQRVEGMTDSQLSELLYWKTQGNPFFLEELISLLQRRDVLVQTKTGWRLRDNASLEIPDSVKALVTEHLERLGKEAEELLRMAAVIGREFPSCLLREVMGWEEERIVTILDRCETARLVISRQMQAEEIYYFTHDLLQESLYDGIGRAQRRRQHLRIGQAIEELYAGRLEDRYDALAHHFCAGNNLTKAVEYCALAARAAAGVYAHDKAIVYFEQALSALAQLPKSEERLKKAIDIRVELGSTLSAARGYAAPEVKENYARAHELCDKLGETPQLFPVLWGLSLSHRGRGALQESRQLGEQLLFLAGRAQDPELLLEAHHTLWATLFNLGQFVSARGHLEQGDLLYAPQRHRHHAFLYGGHDPGVCCRQHAARALLLLGHPDQALRKSEDAVALARELTHPFSLGHALFSAAWVCLHRGDWQTAQERAEDIIRLGTDEKLPRWVARGTILRGRLLAEQRQEDGIALMRGGLSALVREPLQRDYFTALLAEAYQKVGRVEEGLSEIGRALVRVKETGFFYYEAELQRIKGDLLLEQAGSDGEQFETCFQRAIAIARRQGAKALELRAATSLGRLLLAQGKRNQAKTLLAETYGWFTEGFDTADLKEAKVLLEELS